MPRAAAERHHCRMEVLVAVLAILVAIAILYELARRLGVPYPDPDRCSAGSAWRSCPACRRIALEPDLVLLVFLPPLLFSAAVETPIRDLRANLVPIARLSIGLVLFTMVFVAVVAHAIVPDSAGAERSRSARSSAPTDALAATSVFRRLGAPRVVVTLIEGEALFNDATALVAYRAAVLAVVTGSFVLSDALVGFFVAAVGGIALGIVVGRGAGEMLARLDDPPVEVAISLSSRSPPTCRPTRWGLSGVLAAVTAGLVIGGRLGTILTPSSRVLWLSTWKMIGFILNGFVFVLIGLELPGDPRGPRGPAAGHAPGCRGPDRRASWSARGCVWVFASSLLPNSPRR